MHWIMSRCVYVVLSPSLLPVLAPMACSFGCAMACPSIMAKRLGSRSPAPLAPAPARATGMPPAATHSCRSRSCRSSEAPVSGQPQPGQRAWSWRRSASSCTPRQVSDTSSGTCSISSACRRPSSLLNWAAQWHAWHTAPELQPRQLAQLPVEPGYAQGRYLLQACEQRVLRRHGGGALSAYARG